jgi:hypothetical protein
MGQPSSDFEIWTSPKEAGAVEMCVDTFSCASLQCLCLFGPSSHAHAYGVFHKSSTYIWLPLYTVPGSNTFPCQNPSVCGNFVSAADTTRRGTETFGSIVTIELHNHSTWDPVKQVGASTVPSSFMSPFMLPYM